MDVGDIYVARLMTSTVTTVIADTLVEDAAQTLLEMEIGSLVVVDDDGKLEGIITGTDFIGIVARSDPKAETAVERYMSEEIVTARAQDPIAAAAEKMTDHDIEHLPVVDDEGAVIGILSSTDLTRYLSAIEGDIA